MVTTKMAIILPTGQWYAPSAVIDDALYCMVLHGIAWYGTELHKLWYPGIRDTSTWRKFGAYGEHGDVFLFFNFGAL